MASTNLTKPSAAPNTDVFAAMRDEMDRMFERFEQGLPRWPSPILRGNGRDWMVPELDVHDSGKQVSIEVDLPGVEEKDVKVTVAGGVLTIKGEKKSEHAESKGGYRVSERSYGSFERSLTLPDGVDESKLEAKFDKGVLKITAQKRPEAQKTERQIEVKRA